MKSGRHLHNTHTMSVYEEMRPARSDGELRSLLSVRRSELAEINSTARVRVSEHDAPFAAAAPRNHARQVRRWSRPSTSSTRAMREALRLDQS